MLQERIRTARGIGRTHTEAANSLCTPKKKRTVVSITTHAEVIRKNARVQGITHTRTVSITEEITAQGLYAR